MTVADNKKTASYEVELEAGDYEFKMIKNGTWLTKANNGNAYGLHRDWTGVAGVSDEASENLKLTADIAGKYTFVWTFEKDSIGVEFPALPIIYCEYATGHAKDANFGDANGRILLTIQKIADSNDLRVAVKNNTAAGNQKTGVNFLWVNVEGATGGVVRYGDGTHAEADVEEASVIIPFNEAKESYNFVNIHWAYSGWEGEWAIDGLTVLASELCEAAEVPVEPETHYYMKNNWDAGDWTWKEMTKDGDNYKLQDVVFGGAGVNYNTAESDENSTWVELADFAGDNIKAKDTVTLVLNPATGTVTATLLRAYVEPVVEGAAFYLCGTITEWAVSEAYKFTANPNNEGEYVLNTTLTEGAGLKVVKAAAGEILTWYPEGMGNEYVVDATHAGEVTIYFRETYNEDWAAFGGYIYITETTPDALDNLDATQKPIKVIRNGQVLIIRGENIYNAQGQKLQ